MSSRILWCLTFLIAEAVRAQGGHGAPVSGTADYNYPAQDGGGKPTEKALVTLTFATLDEDCLPNKKCDADPMPKADPNRKKWDAHVSEAANATGIEPSLIKAQLHAETSMRPLLENEIEKQACQSKSNKCHKDYQWGKGPGQFGANNAALYGLDWNHPKPSNEIERQRVCGEILAPGLNEFPPPRPTPIEIRRILESRLTKRPLAKDFPLQPIWCPRAAAIAKAIYMREILDEEHLLRLRDPLTGKDTDPPRWIRVDLLYKRNAVESARFIAGSFNRGRMPINSIYETYRQKRSLPGNYAAAWMTARQTDTPYTIRPRVREKWDSDRDQILKNEHINKCHVFKIAGLCGDHPQGYLAEYRDDYQQDLGTGLWAPKVK